MGIQAVHPRLLVTNFQACFEFYAHVLNLPYRGEDTTGPYAEFYDVTTNATLFGLFVREYMAGTVHTAHKPVQADAQDTIALCLEVDDVDATAALVKAAGYSLVNEPMNMEHWTLRVAHFRDPDGNLIEINQNLPQG
jgi:predicted enzyme related to lactoylglutathione lyase